MAEEHCSLQWGFGISFLPWPVRDPERPTAAGQSVGLTLKQHGNDKEALNCEKIFFLLLSYTKQTYTQTWLTHSKTHLYSQTLVELWIKSQDSEKDGGAAY